MDVSTHGADASVPIKFAETGHKVISFEGSPAKFGEALQAILPLSRTTRRYCREAFYVKFGHFTWLFGP